MSAQDDRIFDIADAARKELDEASGASSVEQKDTHSAIVEICTRFEFKPSPPTE
jgi:hypothetical protein